MSSPASYRKKPVVIEAIRWHNGPGCNCRAVDRFLGVDRTAADYMLPCDSEEVTIHTLEGTMYADPGDWIIRGVEGEFYPCKPSIFEATYEAVTTDE
jgi:hypothetical protein